MSALVRLYPRAWRERYGAEFLELLADRPASARDRFDILHGALDAWIHPQVRATPAANGEPRPLRLTIAGPAVVGAILLIASGLATYAAPMGGFGYKETGALTTVLVGGLIAVAFAAVAMARITSAGSGAAAAILAGAFITLLPWPILIVGFLLHAIATVGFGVILFLSGRRLMGGALTVSALLLTSFNTEDERALLTIPIGLAWILVGLLAIRLKAPQPITQRTAPSRQSPRFAATDEFRSPSTGPISPRLHRLQGQARSSRRGRGARRVGPARSPAPRRAPGSSGHS